MSQDSSKVSLADKIRRMLAREFDTLPPDAVAGVLANLASELVMLSEAGLSSMSEVQDAKWSAREEPLSIKVLKDNVVEVEATTGRDVHDIMNQVMNVGAVMLQLTPAPSLNSAVNVRFSFPAYHLHLASTGRVVYTSEKGTAIELAQLGKEDRAAIEAVWPEVVSKTTLSRETPIVPPISVAPEVNRTSLGAPVVRASESVPIPGIGQKTQQRFRRRIDLTDPDVKVISSTHLGLKALETREFYGPEIHTVEPNSEADRIERLVDERIVDILLQLSQSNHTGMLELLDDEGVKRQVLFDGGFVVEMSRHPRRADEELGLMLLRADRITKQQLAMAAAHADELGCNLERSLLDLGILDPDRIRHAIAGRLTFLIRELINVRSGEVQVYESNALPTGFLPAPPLRVHVAIERVIFRKFFEHYKQVPLRDRESHMQSYLDAYPEIVPDERERAERTLTEEEHLKLADNVITGRRRLREVFTESTLAHAETYAVVHTLHRMGLLRFDRSLHQTVVRERFRENVTVKFLSVHKASYFEVLNVHWSSYDEVVQKAYDELIVQFDPSTVPEHLEPEVHQRVSEIRDRVESAYQVLSSREPRHAYRKRIMPEYKLAHAIPLFLKQSELAEKRRNWAEALDAARRVTEIEPGHKDAAFRAQRLLDIIENRLSPDALDSNF
ncbi:MAG: hypothetical protein R3E66_12115 [bacterium]